MKKLLFNLLVPALLCFVATQTEAQIRTPQPSPSAEITQTVGLDEITINYSRPNMKGRPIFSADGLVPLGKVWRTGANSATKFSFGGDVTIGGKELKAGDYAVLTTPAADEWKVMLYPYESGNWSSYVDKEPAATVTAKPKKLADKVESFTIGINELAMDGASIDMMWENTKVSIPVKVNTDAQVMASIESTMAGPTGDDYFAAASYYHESGKDLKKALEYVQKATKDGDKFWQIRREALILADLKMYDEAIKAAEKSMALAKEAKNEDYIRMNEKSIAEWKKMK